MIRPPTSGPAQYLGKWAILFAPGSTDIRQKNQDQDDAVLIEGRRAWVGDVVEQLVRIAGDGNLFNNITLNQYESLFRRASREMGIEEVKLTPHVVRHAGPSRDRLDRSRTLQEIQRRGRWRCVQSMNRYEKEGKALRSWSKLTQADRELYTRAAAIFPSDLVAWLKKVPRLGVKQEAWWLQ